VDWAVANPGQRKVLAQLEVSDCCVWNQKRQARTIRRDSDNANGSGSHCPNIFRDLPQEFASRSVLKWSRYLSLAIARTNLWEERGSKSVPISPPFGITKLTILAPRKSVRFLEENDLAKMESNRKWKDLSISTDIELERGSKS
jgi:hypothetical protein